MFWKYAYQDNSPGGQLPRGRLPTDDSPGGLLPPEDDSPAGRLPRRTSPPEDDSLGGRLPRRTTPPEVIIIIIIIQDIYPAGESSSGGDVLRGSCPAGETSSGGVVLRGRRLPGELSCGGVVLRGRRPPGETSSGGVVLRGSCQVGVIPGGVVLEPKIWYEKLERSPCGNFTQMLLAKDTTKHEVWNHFRSAHSKKNMHYARSAAPRKKAVSALLLNWEKASFVFYADFADYLKSQ